MAVTRRKFLQLSAGAVGAALVPVKALAPVLGPVIERVTESDIIRVASEQQRIPIEQAAEHFACGAARSSALIMDSLGMRINMHDVVEKHERTHGVSDVWLDGPKYKQLFYDEVMAQGTKMVNEWRAS